MKSKILQPLGFVFLIFFLLVSVFELIVFNESFYDTQYQKLNTAQNMAMSHDDLMKSTHVLLDYIKDERDDIDVMVSVDGELVSMFNQREIDHMVDVKNLFLTVDTLKWVSVIGLGVLLLTGIYKTTYYEAMKKAIVIYLIVFGTIGFYALIDFSNFWILFHKLLFTNDLWLLNPATDRMINLFPEIFFNRLVMRVILGFVIVFGSLFGVSKYLEKRDRA